MSSADTNTDVSALAAPPVGLEEWHLDLHADGARREDAVGAAARAAAARRPVRGVPAERDAPPALGGRARRARAGGRRRCRDLGPPAARRLPRREQLPHVGVQVRAARSRGEGAAARVARPRGDARAGGLGELRPRRAGPRRRRRERCSARGRPRGNPDGADSAAARRCSSRPCSKASRSTCSPSASTRTATRSTRCSTTPDGGCETTSPRRDSRR